MEKDNLENNKEKVTKKKFSRSKIAIFAIVITSLYFVFEKNHYPILHKVIYSDVLHYYTYLPATFIEGDYTLSFTHDEYGLYKAKYMCKYWPQALDNGGFAFKTTMGLAICYSPFFFIASAFVHVFGGFDADGFSPPYALALMFSCISFLLLGLIFLRKLLLKYFSDLATAITLVVIVVTTNMFWYTCSFQSPASHVYSFSFVAIFLYFTDKWFDKQNWKNTIWIGLSFGMISLIRPSNALIAIVFVLYGISSLEGFKQRIRLFLKNYKYILAIIFFSFIVWIPQLLYWKTVTGNFFYYSYGSDERFFFDNPFILHGLFGFKTGWLIYSPIMIFSLIGLYFLNKKVKGFLLPISVFFIINVYVIFSWWSWWYGGGFGVRPLIDCYPLLAIPLAAFFDWLLKTKRKVKIPVSILVTIVALQSAFHVYQYFLGIIHWSDMTKESYVECFWKGNFPENYESLLRPMNDSLAMKGNRNQIQDEN